jgi:Ca2+-binding RTX toxin-like protein
LAIIHVSGNKTKEFSVKSSQNTYILDRDGTIFTDTSPAFIEDSPFHDNRIKINGQIDSGANIITGALSVSGQNSKILVSSTGEIRGEIGAELSGTNQRIVNHGHIEGHFETMTLAFDGSVFNDGLLTGGRGIVGSSSISVINDKGGRISTTGDGVDFFAPDGSHSALLNEGVIKSATAHAVLGQDGSEHIVNHGRMMGEIDLGAGDDIFDNRGGKIDHNVIGGAGDDTLYVNDKSTLLIEAFLGGIDTVKSTVSYTLSAHVDNLDLLGHENTKGVGNKDGNQLVGNDGDNILIGAKGQDWLNGGGGDDLLRGGLGENDVFYFRNHFGHDTVADFEGGLDNFYFAGVKGIASFGDLQNHIEAHHGDLIIHAGENTVTIHDTKMGDLTAGNVFFGM